MRQLLSEKNSQEDGSLSLIVGILSANPSHPERVEEIFKEFVEKSINRTSFLSLHKVFQSLKDVINFALKMLSEPP